LAAAHILAWWLGEFFGAPVAHSELADVVRVFVAWDDAAAAIATHVIS
jgi:hypothetical protein